MAGWTGWVAAVGGLLTLLGYVSALEGLYLRPLGAIVAIIFGIWAAYSD